MEWMSRTGRKMVLMDGDITRVPVDAMVNAANRALVGGGGVDGAIHRAGGGEIMRELDAIRERTGGCATGSAVATGAGRLPARHVFHAVGPVYRDGRHGEAELLASCYRTCLAMAEERGAATISFPAISTGVYGYPPEEAARIALGVVKNHLELAETKVQHVVFVLFGKQAYRLYADTLATI
ncbi:MAG: O-acetyl-ADP-ribose deacetylase [Bryobacteraceae bacterium]|jgi:O-acetyl-ADP-ribose deacetylase (regulator of RNase III)